MRRTASAANSIRSGCGRSGGAEGLSHAAAARKSARPATTAKAGAVPVYDATAPRTGPNIAPAIAPPNAAPINRPRRPAGEAVTSHARAPVHEKALEAPWTNRAV